MLPYFGFSFCLASVLHNDVNFRLTTKYFSGLLSFLCFLQIHYLEIAVTALKQVKKINAEDFIFGGRLRKFFFSPPSPQIVLKDHKPLFSFSFSFICISLLFFRLHFTSFVISFIPIRVYSFQVIKLPHSFEQFRFFKVEVLFQQATFPGNPPGKKGIITKAKLLSQPQNKTRNNGKEPKNVKL